MLLKADGTSFSYGVGGGFKAEREKGEFIKKRKGGSRETIGHEKTSGDKEHEAYQVLLAWNRISGRVTQKLPNKNL